MADQQQKYCNRPGCGVPIKWTKRGERNVPLNMDGTDHHCNQAAPATQEKDDSLIGIYQGITLKRLNIVRKDKKILVSPATPKLMADLADPANPLKNGMKVKVTFTKAGEADTIEICPDQPAPVVPKETAAQQPVTKSPVQEKPPETRTSPQGPPPPAESRKKSSIEEKRLPTREELLDMVYSPDTYWRGKTLMDIEDAERIRIQIEVKNRFESVIAAVGYHEKQPVDLESVLVTANRIYEYATGKKPAGAQ